VVAENLARIIGFRLLAAVVSSARRSGSLT
jgi:hypothetical protein